jgi:hypothetical protein
MLLRCLAVVCLAVSHSSCHDRVIAMVQSISLTRKWSGYSSNALSTVGIFC